MIFKVDLYHNVTTVLEAYENGETDFMGDVLDRKTSPAIFLRRMGEPKTRPGDRLQLVVTLQLEAPSTASAADAAFAAGNAPYDTPEVRAYRAAEVRSLCSGDVVVVHSPDGPAAYSCESFGWSSVDLNDFTIKEIT